MEGVESRVKKATLSLTPIPAVHLALPPSAAHSAVWWLYALCLVRRLALSMAHGPSLYSRHHSRSFAPVFGTLCAPREQDRCTLRDPRHVFFCFSSVVVNRQPICHSRASTMAHQEKRYCRGCKCTADASVFIGDGQQYKQCDRCRARIHDRQRSDATIVCECGREVLRTSVRDHLRTLYHEKRMSEKQAVQTAQKTPDVAGTPMRMAGPAAVSQQRPKSAVIQQIKPAAIPPMKPAVIQQQLKPASASVSTNLPRPVSFVFRKANAAAPVTNEPLRTTLKQVQTPTPVRQK